MTRGTAGTLSYGVARVPRRALRLHSEKINLPFKFLAKTMQILSNERGKSKSLPANLAAKSDALQQIMEGEK